MTSVARNIPSSYSVSLHLRGLCPNGSSSGRAMCTVRAQTGRELSSPPSFTFDQRNAAQRPLTTAAGRSKGTRRCQPSASQRGFHDRASATSFVFHRRQQRSDEGAIYRVRGAFYRSIAWPARPPLLAPRACMQTSAGGKGEKDQKSSGSARVSEEPPRAGDSSNETAGSLSHMRDRLQEVRRDATEDAKDWIRDKRDDMDEMRETLRDAQRDGRLTQELSDQAREGRGKVRELWKKYGAVAIGTYFGIYFTTIAGFYVVYDYGFMSGMPAGGSAVLDHVKEIIGYMPESVQQYADKMLNAMAEDRRARSFVLAWATCKVVEPLRLIATLAITPRMARALGRAPALDVGDEKEEDKSIPK